MNDWNPDKILEKIEKASKKEVFLFLLPAIVCFLSDKALNDFPELGILWIILFAISGLASIYIYGIWAFMILFESGVLSIVLLATIFVGIGYGVLSLFWLFVTISYDQIIHLIN